MPYQQVIIAQPQYLQPKQYTAQDDRRFLADFISSGVVGSGDFAVTAVTGMTVAVAAGKAYVAGQHVTDQGNYRVYQATSQNITATAAHATLPRIDTVILRVMDGTHDTSGKYETRIEIVPGTPTSGANLTNLTGKANLTTLDENSKNVLLLAYLLITAADGTISSGDIQDERVRATVGAGAAVAGSSLQYSGARVYHASNQSVGADGISSLNFDSEDFDTDGYHDTVTNNTRLTVPTGKGGKFEVGFTGSWSNTWTTYQFREVVIRKNGTIYVGGSASTHYTAATALGGSYFYHSVVCYLALIAGDYVEARALNPDNASKNISARGASDESLAFWIRRLSD